MAALVPQITTTEPIRNPIGQATTTSGEITLSESGNRLPTAALFASAATSW